MADINWKKPFPVADLTGFALLIGALIWLVVNGTRFLGYNWQWYRVPHFVVSVSDGRLFPGPLAEGLLTTLKISGISLVLAFAIGLTTAILRLSTSFVGRSLARAYLEIIRNTPLLVQLFFIYFVLSPVLDISRFASAVLALSLFEGAYASEIFRAGIISIPRGQWEAAFSSGLSTAQTYRYIVFPQAMRQILPPITGQAISLIKDSALVSTIAIYDLTMQGQSIIAETFLTFEIWFTVAAIYLAITLILSGLANILENHYRLNRI